METLKNKVEWSTDHCILKVAHEYTQVKRTDANWTFLSFVRTNKSLPDYITENLEFEIESTKLIQAGAQGGIFCDLLSVAKKTADANGICCLGVVVDHIKGAKFQSVYEAASRTLIGQVFWQSFNVIREVGTRVLFMRRAHMNALHVYCGGLFFDVTWKALHDLRSIVSRVAYVTLNGGNQIVGRTCACIHSENLKQRFAIGGVGWKTYHV
jgi:argininosuccinate synthase